MQRTITLVVLVISLALGACGDSTDPAAYFPTDTGLRWTYQIRRTTMDGTAEQLYFVENYGNRQLSPELDAHVQRTFEGNRYYYHRGRRGWTRVAVQGVAEEQVRITPEPWLLIPAEPILGSTWQQPTITRVLEKTGPPQVTLFRIQAQLPVTYKVAAVSDVVTVPAGRFARCLRIEGEGSLSTNVGNYIGTTSISLRSTDWYAPGVGLVKSELTESTSSDALNHGALTIELRDLRK